MSELDYLIEELWQAIEDEDQVMVEYYTKQIDSMMEGSE